MGINSFSLNAQEVKSKEVRTSSFDLGADIYTRYIWRGLLYSSAPNLQPDISYTLGNFTIGSWASYAMSQEYSEVDFYISYQLGDITFTVFDYFNENENNMSSAKYFEFGKDTTIHALEGTILFQGKDNFPISLTASTFFYGNDRDSDNKNFYSTYFEIGYPFTIAKKSINTFLGFTPSKGLYSDGFAIVNIGVSHSKEIKVTDHFSIPITGQVVINPDAEDIFFVLGISF